MNWPMTQPAAITLAPADARRIHLDELEAQLSRREGELAALKLDLRALQDRYLGDIGALYQELAILEAAIAEEEIRQGLRQPPTPIDDDDAQDDDAEMDAACSNPAAPSDDLKRVFRDVAKSIHPDLAMDEPARCRRHSLMAEANRAYAERDEDRLRLILSAWERSADAVVGDHPEADEERYRRKVTEIDERLIAIEAEFADLKKSAIWRLKGKIDDATRQGWDLFAEMILQVKREIERARMRASSLSRSAANVGRHGRSS